VLVLWLATGAEASRRRRADLYHRHERHCAGFFPKLYPFLAAVDRRRHDVPLRDHMAIACLVERAPCFTFSDVMHFFAHKLARLRAGGFPSALRFYGSLDSFFL